MLRHLMLRHLPLIALGLICAAPAAAIDMPARKAGLWDMKITFEGGRVPPQASQHCIDATTDKQMMNMGGNMRQQSACSKQDIKQVGNTIVMDSVCKVGAATTTSHAVVSGNFNSAYTVKVSSKSEGGPAVPGAPAGGTTNITIDAKWLGPCKADQKPGDIIMAGGQKFNVRDMQNMQGMQKGLPEAVRKAIQNQKK